MKASKKKREWSFIPSNGHRANKLGPKHAATETVQQWTSFFFSWHTCCMGKYTVAPWHCLSFIGLNFTLTSAFCVMLYIRRLNRRHIYSTSTYESRDTFITDTDASDVTAQRCNAHFGVNWQQCCIVSYSTVSYSITLYHTVPSIVEHIIYSNVSYSFIS